MAKYQVKVYSAAGEHLATFVGWERMAFTRKVNDVSEHAIEWCGSQREIAEMAGWFELDGQVEVLRCDPDVGVDWYVEYEGLHRRQRIWKDDKGWHFCSSGYSYMHLLARRIVAAYAETSGSDKAGPAETVMKAYVREQIGPDAGERSAPYFSVEANGGRGNYWSGTGMGKNLLNLLQEIAAVGGGDFDVVGTGHPGYEFRWYTGQRGTDRRDSVIFSLELGNMANPVWEAAGGQANAVLVAGQGEGAERERLWVEDEDAQGLSPWNRIEVFRDARDVPSGDTEALTLRGQELLAQNRGVRSLRFDVQQTLGYRYGAHYFLGDLVTAQFMGVSVARKITAVTFQVERAETISVEMSDV